VLSRVLQRVRPASCQPGQDKGSGVVVGLGAAADDAALVRPPPPGHLMLHTVDFFRSFWSDPFVFGKVRCPLAPPSA
jgi:selenide,water dikinase